MQRLPARTVAVTADQNTKERAAVSRGENRFANAFGSPVRQLASRIKEEQGAEQLKAFLLAMRPFAAPNELDKIGADNGIDFKSACASALEAEERAKREAEPSPKAPAQQNGMQSQLQTLQKLMYLQSLMNGQEASALFGTMNKGR